MILERLFNTPEKRARLARWAWLISLFMLVMGYIIIFLFWDG
jgi:hypothetical protein